MSEPFGLDLDALSPEMRAAVEEAHAVASARGYADPEPDDEKETIVPLRTSSGAIPVCGFCGAEIPSTRYAYRRVVGYERQRRQGGTNALRLREQLDEFACSRCVDEAAAGRDPGQGALL